MRNPNADFFPAEVVDRCERDRAYRTRMMQHIFDAPLDVGYSDAAGTVTDVLVLGHALFVETSRGDLFTWAPGRGVTIAQLATDNEES